jgi:hypothetical protein
MPEPLLAILHREEHDAAGIRYDDDYKNIIRCYRPEMGATLS